MAGYLTAQALEVPSLFDVFIRLKLLPGAALGASHTSRSSVRRGTSVPLSGLTRRPPSPAAAPHGHPCHSQRPGRFLSS